MRQGKQIRHAPETIDRARRLALTLDEQPDSLGRFRTACHSDAVRAATLIGLDELERRHGIKRH